MGAQGYLVYQSPANGNYYPLTGIPGNPANHSTMSPYSSVEPTDPNNFLLDSSGNKNPNFIPRISSSYECSGSTPRLSSSASHRDAGLFYLAQPAGDCGPNADTYTAQGAFSMSSMNPGEIGR